MYVAGIDAHKTYLVIAVVSKHGERVLRPTRVKVTEPGRIVDMLAGYRPVEAVVETSLSWPWLHELLAPHGIPLVLAHARRLRAIAEANYKRDEIDAELLARMRLAGCIPEVYVRPFDQRQWAGLIRHRMVLVRDRTRLINRMHAQLHQVGLGVDRGRLLTRKGQRWLHENAWPRLGPEARRLVRSHIHLVRTLNPLVQALDRRIAHVASTVPEAVRLQSIPGIGPYRSLLICGEALPISRFQSPAHLVSYAGLAPRSSQSGMKPVRFGHIPAGANRHLRGALVKAVTTHVQFEPESWLSAYYQRQKQRMPWQIARIATARKLCRAVHAILRRQIDWQNQLAIGVSSFSRVSH